MIPEPSFQRRRRPLTKSRFATTGLGCHNLSYLGYRQINGRCFSRNAEAFSELPRRVSFEAAACRIHQ
ncbi:Uncharacterized protein HZ326_28766 [Fusarium oxysporum f. sp. albedinis]|nr:Uncharacterized protein HZ326_28766 [Fusarium oxysporum f. sp. albedinis]